MNRLTAYLDGRKTNFLAAALFTMAVTAAVNGWTGPELAAFAASVAGLAATLRAAIGKPVVITALLAAVFTMTACAGFFEKGPDGVSESDRLNAGVSEFALLLPPPWNTLIPAAVGLGSIALAGVVRSADPE